MHCFIMLCLYVMIAFFNIYESLFIVLYDFKAALEVVRSFISVCLDLNLQTVVVHIYVNILYKYTNSCFFRYSFLCLCMFL